MDGTLSLKRHLPDDFDNSGLWTPYFYSDVGYSTATSALGPSSLLFQAYPFYVVQVGQEGPSAQASRHFAGPPIQRSKRRRLAHDPAMLAMPSCIDCQVGPESEKSNESLPLLENYSSSSARSSLSAPVRGGSFIGAAAEGVVDFLSALATCQTSPAEGGHAEFTTSAQETRQSIGTPFSIKAESCSSDPFDGLYTDNLNSATTESWVSDNSTSQDAPIQSFPALQPASSQPVFFPINPELQSLQPSTHLENMSYPIVQQTSTNTIEAFQMMPPHTESLGFPTEFQAAFDAPNFIGGALSSLDSANQPVFSTPALMATPLSTADAFPAPLDDSTSLTPVRGSVHANSTIVSPPTFSISPMQPNPLHQYAQQHHLDHVLAVSYMDEAEVHAKSPHPRPPVSRRGPFKDHAERQRTAETRKIGSCVRCRMQRVRCNADPNDASGECLGCKKPLSRTWRLPCMRLKISDIVLAKTCQVKGHEWTLRWKENTIVDNIGNWASSDIRIIRVTEGYTDSFVELKVRQFKPQEGDSLVRSWVTPTGETRSVKIPPYAIVEPQSIRSQYIKYIKESLWTCCFKVVSQSDRSGFIWSVYRTAFELTQTSDPSLTDQERNLLVTALELWMSVRLTTRSFEIVGDETLGMPKDIIDSTSTLCGKIPVPPVMGAQLDSVIIHEIQAKLRREVLDGLHKLITENKARSWFTSYLVTFILLHNAALVIDHDASYAKKHGMKRRFAREERVKQYYTGAITLLVYFHYCNKGVFPFTEDAREQDVRSIANLDDRAMQHIRETRCYVAENRSKWQAMREKNDYGNDCFFLSQLFEANWQPQDMVLS